MIGGGVRERGVKGRKERWLRDMSVVWCYLMLFERIYVKYATNRTSALILSSF